MLQEKNKTLDDIIENRLAMASLETGRSFRKLFSKEEIMIVPLGVVRKGPIKNLLCGQNCQGVVVAAVTQRTGTGSN